MIIDDDIIRWQRNSTRSPRVGIFPITRDETVDDIPNIHYYIGGCRTQAGSCIKNILTFCIIIGGGRGANGHRYQ